MDDIRERLLRRDYLYTDAQAYRAGVEAALAAVGTQAPPALDSGSERGGGHQA